MYVCTMAVLYSLGIFGQIYDTEQTGSINYHTDWQPDVVIYHVIYKQIGTCNILLSTCVTGPFYLFFISTDSTIAAVFGLYAQMFKLQQ